MQLFKVYPLADERVKEVALLHLNTTNRGEFTCLYTHYSIEHNFFCNEGDEEWCDNYVVCDYDNEYLKMSYICYTVNSWKYDNFLNRKYDETFDCWWEHMEGDAYNKAVKCYTNLLLHRKSFKDKMLDMNVVMKKKTHKDIRHTIAFPDKEETLFDTRGI